MVHLVTGATGFVGSALVLELLQQGDGPIVGIVRPRAGDAPTERLRSVLRPLVAGYALPEALHDEIETRVCAVAGDIEEPLCGVESKAEWRGAEFWHCAASLQYQDRHQRIIERSNVGGTAHALELAQRTGSRRFNMVSTAYVAGCQRGMIAPKPGDLDLVNNLYERSKVNAEHSVRSSGLLARILRPGIVIGHSRTRFSTSGDGLYGFLRSLRKFRGVVERMQPGLADRLMVKIVAEANGLVDLIPVDHVVGDAVALSVADAPAGTYHLTNATPPRIGPSLRTSFAAAGLLPPEVVAEADGLNAVDMKLHERIGFYSSYIRNGKQFDRSTVQDVLGAAASGGFWLDDSVLEAFCRWYLDAFEASRVELPVLR